MQGLKLIHVSKKGHNSIAYVLSNNQWLTKYTEGNG